MQQEECFIFFKILISKLIWNNIHLSKVTEKPNYTLIMKAENLLKSINFFNTVAVFYFSRFFQLDV